LLAGRLASQLPGGVVLVTGTNGKTTTTMLLAAGLGAAGEQVLTNPTGSNLRQGILSALLASCDASGQVRGTVGVFEVDELTLPLVVAQVRPRMVVVLNLFRDQLDRHAELDMVAQRLADGLRLAGTDVLLNADDPLVADLARRAGSQRASFFGIDESAGVRAEADAISDADRCPVCGSQLEYSTVFFAQMGHYRCPAGDFRRPAPTCALVRVEEVEEVEETVGAGTGTGFVARLAGMEQAARTASPGTYSLYNSLAALAACVLLGADPGVAADAISACLPAYGRGEAIEVAGRSIRLVLVKNPVGFAQVIDTFLRDDPTTPLLIGLNDAAADGRDTSWIWDIPMDSLAGRGDVIACGTRTEDMVLRLKYADVEAQACPPYAEALQALLAKVPAGGTAYAMANYTAMLGLRRTMLEHPAAGREGA
jgi:UDP-N-acetylmuramyl tripeptide synthase